MRFNKIANVSLTGFEFLPLYAGILVLPCSFSIVPALFSCAASRFITPSTELNTPNTELNSWPPLLNERLSPRLTPLRSSYIQDDFCVSSPVASTFRRSFSCWLSLIATLKRSAQGEIRVGISSTRPRLRPPERKQTEGAARLLDEIVNICPNRA